MSAVRLAVLAGFAGLAAAAFTVDFAGVRAESPMDFLRKQHRREYREPPRYAREPVRVERRGFFNDLFGLEERPPPSRRRVAERPNLERVICRRQCDSAQLVLGILPRGKHGSAEAMCAAAGGGASTELVVENFVPGEGFKPPPRVMTASAAPLLEGRAALDANMSDAPAPRFEADTCAADTKPFMMVPVLHDATLRKGDVVATHDGFKVFVGGGKPPHKQSDFVPIEKRKGVASSIRKLKVADR